MFRIKKRYLFICGVVSVIMLFVALLYVFTPRKSLCDNKSFLPKCEIAFSTNKDVVIVTGVLSGKYKKGSQFYFQMTTLDKNKRSHAFTFTTPQNFPKIIIDKVSLSPTKAISTDMLGTTVSVSEFFNFVNPQMPLRIFIYNPKKLTKEQISQAPPAISKCIPYQISVLESLENPSIKNTIASGYLGLRDNCQLVLANVSI